MKRIAETSRAALHAIADELPTRAAEVLDALQRYWHHHRTDPTAYELLRWMQIENPTLDLNSVRPRLTELTDAGRVQTADKRRCAVTEKRVYTWRIVPTNTAAWVDRSPVNTATQDSLF